MHCCHIIIFKFRCRTTIKKSSRIIKNTQKKKNRFKEIHKNQLFFLLRYPFNLIYSLTSILAVIKIYYCGLRAIGSKFEIFNIRSQFMVFRREIKKKKKRIRDK